MPARLQREPPRFPNPADGGRDSRSCSGRPSSAPTSAFNSHVTPWSRDLELALASLGAVWSRASAAIEASERASPSGGDVGQPKAERLTDAVRASATRVARSTDERALRGRGER